MKERSRLSPNVLNKKVLQKTAKKNKKPLRKVLLCDSTIALFFHPYHQENESKEGFVSQIDLTANHLFENLKNVNKVVVKGLKVYESLKELRLAGVLFPFTLLLTGKYEDLKVIKQAWIKRHLKNPKGYFIREIGVVQDLTIELVQQSPFLSLSTALFDAVADLNNRSIYPTKVDLHEYLSKHYSDIKTPDLRTIHECLGRLIRDRRLYHNGRGYFILHNENILNEAIAMKSYELHGIHNDAHIKEFVFNSSSFMSSSQAPTDFETSKSYELYNHSKDFLTSAKGLPYESHVNNVYDSNQANVKRAKLCENKQENISVEVENYELLTENQSGSTDKPQSINRPKIKRSQSFSGYETDRSWKKAVSFALVGAPLHNDVNSDSSFKRSYSFGAGRKTNLERPTTDREIEKNTESPVVKINNIAYLDLETSFVDDNLPSISSSLSPSEMIHCPDMLPLEVNSIDVLNHYNDLGSCVSLTAKMGISPYAAADFFPPSKSECLAEELQQAYNNISNENNDMSHWLLSPRSRKNVLSAYDSEFVYDQLTIDTDHRIMKDACTNTFDDDYGSTLSKSLPSPTIKETLENSQSNCDKNRHRSRTKEEKRRKTQKERNTMLFEEKRSSLKIMGMV